MQDLANHYLINYRLEKWAKKKPREIREAFLGPKNFD